MEKRKDMMTLHGDSGMNTAYFLTLMDSYCARVRAYMEDERLLCGAALAARKSLELMGAALLSYDEDGVPVSSRVIDGVTVRPRLNQQRTQQAAMLREGYASVCDGEHGVNRLLHYQAQRALVEKSDAGHRSLRQLTDEQREQLLNRTELEQLKAGHYSMRVIIPAYCRTVSRYMTSYTAVGGADLSAYPHLAWAIEAGRALCSGAADEADVLRYTYTPGDVCARIGVYYEKDDGAVPDPWLSWCCSILSDIQDRAYSDLAAADTMQVLIRKMTERTLLRRLCRLSAEDVGRRILAGEKAAAQKKGEDAGNATLEMYIEEMLRAGSRRFETEPELSQLCRDMCGTAGCIQQNAYTVLHWRADETTGPRTLREKQSFRAELDSQLNFGSKMVDYSVSDNRPVYAWNWIRANRVQWDAMQEKIREMTAALEKERRRASRWKHAAAALAAAVLLAVIGAAALIGGLASQGSHLAPGEMEYTVSVGGEALLPGGMTTVRGGERIRLKALGGGMNISVIAYALGDEEIVPKHDNVAYVDVPYGREGERFDLSVYATGRMNEDDTTVIGDWKVYSFIYEDAAQGVNKDTPTGPARTTMDVFFGGQKLTAGERIFVRPGDVIDVSAYSDAGVAFTGMYLVKNGEIGGIVDYPAGTASFVCPQNESGDELRLYIEAVGKNDNGKPGTITKTGWQEVILCYESPKNNPDALDVRLVNKQLMDDQPCGAWTGLEITARIAKGSGISELRYAWDAEPEIPVPADGLTLTVPASFSAGDKRMLHLFGYDAEGARVVRRSCPLYIYEPAQITMEVTSHGIPLQDDVELFVKAGDVIAAKAHSDAGVHSVGYYSMQAGEAKPEPTETMTDSMSFTCPDMPSGTTLYLYIEAIGKDDWGFANTVTKTGWRCIRLKYR
ncbi:MAG: hypothetical protein J6K32_01675 [Clostridia bacterium]|nr:hypothetical protein [Clostridia bacterium]